MKKLTIIVYLAPCLLAFSCSNGNSSSIQTTSALSPALESLTEAITIAATFSSVPSSSSGADQEYLQSAKAINLTVTNGNWQVTVRRAGVFRAPYSGGIASYIRVDVQIENLDTEPAYFEPGRITIVSFQGEYDVDDARSTLNTLSNYVYPHYPATGYWLFGGPLSSLDTARLGFSAGYDSNFAMLQWSFKL